MRSSLGLGTALAAAAYLLGYVACALAVAVRASGHVAGDDRLVRAFVGTLLFVMQGIGVPLVLTMAGLLGPTPMLVAHIVISAAVLAFVPRTSPADAGDPSTEGRWSLGIGAALIAMAITPTVRAMRSLHYESRHYHIGNLAAWLDERTLWLLPFQNPGLFTATHPGNGEMFALWLALPTHGDHMIYLMNIAFGLLAILSCAMLARDLGGSAGAGALAGLTLVASPIVLRTQVHSIATDMVATSLLVGAAVALIRAWKQPGIAWPLLGGVAVGMALGSKYTVLVPAVAVLAWAVVALRRGRRYLLLIPGLLLFAGPWLVRNAIETGNPVFPLDLRLGPVELAGGQSPIEVLDTTMADHVLHGRAGPLGQWVNLSWVLYGPVMILAAGGIAAALMRKPRSKDRTAVAGLAIVCAITYLITPYTGGGSQGLEHVIGSNLRYALPALMLGTVLASTSMRRRTLVVLIAASFVHAVYYLIQGHPARPDLNVTVLPLAVAAAAWLLWIGARALRNRPGLARPVIAIAVALPLVWGAIFHVDRDRPISRLEATLLGIGSVGGRVLVLGAADLRSVLGTRLDTDISTLADGGAAGERPFADPTKLDEALDSSSANVLVVRRDPGVVAVPPGWVPPPDWQKIADTPTGEVFVRVPPPPPTPETPTTPPSPPPPAVPPPPGIPGE